MGAHAIYFCIIFLIHWLSVEECRYTQIMETQTWYQQLKKPSWAPPAFLFGPVWSLLYIVIFLSFGEVIVLYTQKNISFAVLLPFLLNIVFNIAFTPLQFRLRSNVLASVDVLLLLLTLVWAMIVVFPFAAWITYAQIPYLLWVMFATCLQLTITYLNSK